MRPVSHNLTPAKRARDTYTAQLPFLVLGHPSLLRGRQLDKELLLGSSVGVELDRVDLVRLEEAGSGGGS